MDKTKELILDNGDWTYLIEDESVVRVKIVDGNDVILTAKRDGYSYIRFIKNDGTEKNYYVTVSGGSIWIDLLEEDN